MTNRRRSDRYAVTLPVVIKSASGADEAVTSNVSAHGLAVFCDRKLPVRQYVELELSPPGGRGAIRVTARVARATDRLEDTAGLFHPGLALDLYLFEAAGRLEWFEYLERLRSSGAPKVEGEGPEDEGAGEEDALEEEGAPSYIVKPRDVGRLWAFFRGEMTIGRVRIETTVQESVGSKVELLVVHPESSAEWALPGEVKALFPETRARGPMVEIGLPQFDAELREAFRKFISSGALPRDAETAVPPEEAAPRPTTAPPPPPAPARPSPAPPAAPKPLPAAPSRSAASTAKAPPPSPAAVAPRSDRPFAAFFDEARGAAQAALQPKARAELEAGFDDDIETNPERDAHSPAIDREIAQARSRVEKAPDDATARYRLGKLLVDRGQGGDVKEALSVLGRVVEMEPNHPGAHHATAEAHAKEGRIDAAREHLQRARRLGYRIDSKLERLVSAEKKT